jgi:hypothetical protein
MTITLNRRTAAKCSIVAVVAISLLLATTSAAPQSTHRVGSASAAAVHALKQMLTLGALSPGHRVPGIRANRVGGLTNVSYYNWSGYADDNTGGNTYTKVSGTWKEPTVTCPATETRVAVFWVGLDGFNNGTVEQDGTMAQCFEGTVSYYTWWEMYPSNSIQVVGTSVQPGDSVVSTVTFASGQYTLKVTDSTTPANSFTKTATCGSGLTCSNASAEWVAETPSYARGDSPWPSYSTWKVSEAKTTSAGTSGSISAFPDDDITIVGIGNVPLGKTSVLSDGGKEFNVKWLYAW